MRSRGVSRTEKWRLRRRAKLLEKHTRVRSFIDFILNLLFNLVSYEYTHNPYQIAVGGNEKGNSSSIFYYYNGKISYHYLLLKFLH